MTTAPRRILVIGYGNPGRFDDGLGPALAEQIERLHLPGVSVDSDYQLTVEHAEAVAGYDVVVFADATTDQARAFSWESIEPHEAAVRFTSHHLGPADVLALARDLFAARPQAYLLGIRGCDFGDFGVGLSPSAQAALAEAVAFLHGTIESGHYGRTRFGDESCKTVSR